MLLVSDSNTGRLVACPQFKIILAVVGPDAVLVMDFFAREQISTDHALHHESVLKQIPAVFGIWVIRHANLYIPLGVDKATTLPGLRVFTTTSRLMDSVGETASPRAVDSAPETRYRRFYTEFFPASAALGDYWHGRIVVRRPPKYNGTMVFGGLLDGQQERYSTWGQAEAGHRVWVERVCLVQWDGHAV